MEIDSIAEFLAEKMSAIVIALLFVFVGMALWLPIVKPRLALYGVIFLAPWGGLDVDRGLRLTAYQVLLVLLVIVTLLNFTRTGIKSIAFRHTSALIVFICYGLLRSLLQMSSLPDAQVIGGALRSPEGRAMVQMVMFVFGLSPVFLVPMILRKPEELVSAGRVYLWSATILAFVGWIQLVIWYGTGTNPVPIGLVNSVLGGTQEIREGSYEFMTLSVYRMNSFGGEPKDLGGAFVIGMLLIQVVLMTTKVVHARKLICLWLFLAVSTVSTLSTTAFFLWLIGTGVHLSAQGLFRLKYEKTKISAFQIVGALLLPLALLVAAAEAADIPVVEMVLDRTLNRVDESQFGVFEDFDSAIKDYVLDHPMSALIGVGLGNIHLYADSYLASEISAFAGGGVFVAKAQYLRLLSELGVIGLGLFLFWYLRLMNSTLLRLRALAAPPYLFALIPYGSASLLVFMAAGSGASQFYLTAGVMVSFITWSRNDANRLTGRQRISRSMRF